MSRRLVLVTGTPRSGTTPIGDALAVAAGARTLYEPLNFHVGDRRVSRYFEVVGAGGFTQDHLGELVDSIRRLRLHLRAGVFPEDHGVRRLAKYLTGSRTRMTYRQCRLDPRLKTIVWKDPFATFLVDDLVERHDLPVVATVRPPQAVAASFKRLDWAFDVGDLFDRLAARGHDHRALLEAVDVSTPVGNAAVLWHVATTHLLRSSERHRRVLVLDMEQFVLDRPGTLRRVYEHVDLEWSARVDQHLARTSSAGASTPTRARAHVGPRDPASVNRYWAEVLRDDEVDTVETITEALWQTVRSRHLL